MCFAIDNIDNFASRLGRPITNLLDVIKNDLKIRDIDNNLVTLNDLHHLEVLASDRRLWKQYETVVD